MAKAKVKVGEEMTTYSTNGPTEVAQEIGKSIICIMFEHNVQPQEILGVLGESVAGFLVRIAEPLGYDKREIIKDFGQSLVDAEIGFNE